MGAKLLLAGYFGCGNLGDDAILLGFVEAIKKYDVDLTMLSGAPEESFRAYGIPSVPRKEMAAVNDAISRCDILVFPGGSIFQDVTSVRSVAYYNQLVQKAKKLGKKVVLLGQGIGPLNNFFGKQMACAAFNACDAIAVRDPGSAAALQNLRVKAPIHSAADMAYLLQSPPVGDDDQFGAAGMKTIGLAPRPFGKATKELVKAFGDLSRLLYQNSYIPVLVELDRNEDGPLINEISKTQGGKVPDIKKLDTPMALQKRMARMESIIAMRLHAGILATTVGVPPMMVTYDPKVTAFSKMLDIGSAIPLEGITGARLFENFQTFQKARERNLKIMERKCAELRKQAELNIEVMERFLS